MPKSKAISLVVLDMAGTTIDDHGLVYQALAECVTETGASVSNSDLQLWMGTDKITAIEGLMRAAGREPARQDVTAAFGRFHQILAHSYRQLPPVPLAGIPDALAELRFTGVKVALTTGFDDAVVGPLLSSLDWSVGEGLHTTVDAVVTTSEVTAGRPAPFMIHHAMEKLGVTDVRTVLSAGDTVVDVQAGLNAGTISCAVLSGQLEAAAFTPHQPDYILNSAADIPELLTKITNRD
ncbi:phosphonatase-like hydrolase [Psychromicrobium lacuslunae]|uniref:HAD family hydrolase n=1 Tax=Psychromicrobium lacuslunae TaxID=1618207 RepID=A0A0D4C056_9MICC|nr:phosphonatase-like hydrolase [Psychromicrobium lacuslunae]AJT41736.1 HAD family hydrolase [Psychromicrobium lacuslunae]